MDLAALIAYLTNATARTLVDINGQTFEGAKTPMIAIQCLISTGVSTSADITGAPKNTLLVGNTAGVITYRMAP